VKKVAVLGAGVMGAQIAAHLVNVKVPVVLFDLPAKEGPKNGIVTGPSTTSRSSSHRRWAWPTTPR
jgi:3-hydroxyacyl-CoA dehydrogenase